MTLLDTGAETSFWMPSQGSTWASSVDALFYFILGVSIVFFAIVVFFIILFVARYRRPKGHAAEKSPSHNTPLEVVWSIVPLFLVLIMFLWGFKTFIDYRVAPLNAYEIQVKGQKWKWLFTYPTGYVDETLHIPVERPVRLMMTSDDVIHSLFIPSFRVKMDVVPGRYSTMWFQARGPGEFDLFCAEFCGTEHSHMITKVVVHEPMEFERWLEEASNLLNTMPLAEAGETFYQMFGCSQCHSTDGTPGKAPTWKGLFGRTERLQDGTVVTVDENYIRDSIMNPRARVVAGYEPIMPNFEGVLGDDEIQALVEFIKTLRD